VTVRDGFWPRARHRWLAAWPLWALLIFACLAVVRLLPAGYVRAAVAALILLLVPGSLTLGAAFGERRPRGMAFAGFAALLSVVWSAFASLVLYVIKVLITADTTYLALLIISAGLATAAQARLHRDQPQVPALTGGRGYYVVAAAAAGLVLLGGGVYAEDHLPHPAPAGFTSLAWTGAPIEGPVPIGPHGSRLPFKIVHQQSGTTTFQLQASWLGRRSRVLARPMTVQLGPDRTFQGALFVPSLHDGCTYRIVVTLTDRQIDPETKTRQTWSINADVHEPGQPVKACGA
jgi:hypothetical protein